MSFVLLVCADVRNEKLNLEFPFESKPTVADLLELIERVFRFESSNATQTSSVPTRDAAEPIFTIAKVQIYVDESRQWSDLTSPHQLHMYDQLFVVRKYVTVPDGARRELPRPRTSAYFAGRAAPVSVQQPTQAGSVGSRYRELSSPADPTNGSIAAQRRGVSRDDPMPLSAQGTPRQAGALSASVNQALLEGHATPQEVLRVVFEAADKRRHGVITQFDLGALFKCLSIHVQPDALEEMFLVHAQSGQGRGAADTVMSFKDFTAWASSFEATLNAAFERIISIEKEHRLCDAQRDSAVKITDLVRQKQDMEEALRRLEQDLGRESDRKRALEEELDELLRERNLDITDDQVVIDKEVRVQHHRLLLRQEEDDFAQIAVRRKAAAGGASSSVAALGGGRSYSTQSNTPGRTGSVFGR